MTGGALPIALHASPDSIDSMTIEVIWHAFSDQWGVHFGHQIVGDDGVLVHHHICDFRYSPAECPTAYQALMLGLSEYKKEH